MATDAQIRAWCRDEGIDVPPRGRIGPDYREQYAQAHPDDDDGDQAPAEQPLLDDGGALPAAAEQGDDADTGETPPRRPAGTGPRLKLPRRGGGKPRAARRRVSIEGVCASGWAVLASIAGAQGMAPTARVLQMQAPVAGAILDGALRGSLVDRLLQPVARGQERAADVGALLGPPVIVSMLTMRPQLAPQLLPLLRGTLRQWVIIAGPKLQAQQRKEQKALEALGMEEMAGIDALVDAMIAELFPPEAAPGPVADASAGRHAA